MKHQAQQLNTCSKLILETLEQGAKYIQSQQKRRNRAMTPFCSRVDGDPYHGCLADKLTIKTSGQGQ